MEDEMLIVEDVMLLMLDDETGTPAGAGTLFYTLGGAVLVELALRGRIEADESRGGMSGPKVSAVGGGPLQDPLLQAAYEKIAERPRGVQSLLVEIGGDLWDPVIDRLVERGLILREKKRVLGLFSVKRLPTGDPRHEVELRQRIRAVLVDGESHDARTAAVIGLVSASDALPAVRPALVPWTTEVIQRAKALENAHWATAAVHTAVTRTAVGIATSSTIAAIT